MFFLVVRRTSTKAAAVASEEKNHHFLRSLSFATEGAFGPRATSHQLFRLLTRAKKPKG